MSLNQLHQEPHEHFCSLMVDSLKRNNFDQHPVGSFLQQTNEEILKSLQQSLLRISKIFKNDWT